jgi:hypothetical protein
MLQFLPALFLLIIGAAPADRSGLMLRISSLQALQSELASFQADSGSIVVADNHVEVCLSTTCRIAQRSAAQVYSQESVAGRPLGGFCKSVRSRDGPLRV